MSSRTSKHKLQNAVRLGKRGGLARAESKGWKKIPAAKRKEIAARAAKKRWGKKFAR